MEIVPFAPGHLDVAASLFAENYRGQRRRVGVLPSHHESGEGAHCLLEDLIRRAPGVVAIGGDRVRGYLVGLPIPSFFGNQKGVLAPIWAHAADADDRPGVYRAMYSALGETWLRAGYLNHAITVYADDAAVSDAFFWHAFGLQSVDAIRSLDPLAAAPSAMIEVRRATADQAEVVVPLGHGLSRYIAEAPISFPLFKLPSREDWSRWLAEDGHVLFLAFAGDRPIGYIRLEPPTYDVAYVVHDAKTISISGAFVLPEWRRRNVGAQILGRVVAWAAEVGYERVSVDFEAANTPGRCFWLKHFAPVCHSLVRKVDERILWARPDLPDADLW